MNTDDKNIKRIAVFVAAAAILQMAEALIPSPVPGIKLGLANMIVLIALVNIGFRASFEIAILRSLLSSLLIGTFLSPTFFMSFAGSIVSSVAMGIVYKLTADKKIFSLTGISIIGSAVHNFTQLTVVYFFFIKSPAVFYMLPWLGISSVIMGVITGSIAASVCERIKEGETSSPVFTADNSEAAQGLKTAGRFADTGSVLHRTAPEIKFAGLMILAAVAMASRDAGTLLLLSALMLSLILASKVDPKEYFRGFLKGLPFILISFVLPVISATDRYTGMAAGAVNALRIFVVMAGASVLVRTTSINGLALGINKALAPFGFMGISPKRVSGIITSALTAMPLMYEKARNFLKNNRPEKGNIKAVLATATALIVAVYLMAEEETII